MFIPRPRKRILYTSKIIKKEENFEHRTNFFGLQKHTSSLSFSLILSNSDWCFLERVTVARGVW